MTADMGQDTTAEGQLPADDHLAVGVMEREADEVALRAWAVDVDVDRGDASPPPEDPVAREQRHRFVRLTVDWLVVTACAAFVLLHLHPQQILSSAVPAGGDMGAHVWGPAFLRDHLLPEGRLSGWTPDWYAGFPAYQFYMVVPSLLIVALDVGFFGGWTMILPIGAAAALVFVGTKTMGWQRWGLIAAGTVVAVGAAELPYGIAFKLVTVLGVVSLPLAAYAFGRLAGLPFPGPALLAVASLLFLFDRNFTIYGGNVASTMAGEFAFSISLSLAVVYLGVVIRGLRTGRHRALAAVLLALTGLCHLIPAFFALAGTVVIALARRPAWRTLRWLAAVLPVGGLISAFWVLPFVWQRAYVNDMGWEKLPHATEANGFGALSDTLFAWQGETYWKYLVPRSGSDTPDDLRWVLALAALGLVLSIAFKVRTGLIVAGLTLVMAAGFVLVPEGRLWNARLLPFYYLGLYLLAAIGVAEVGRTLAVLVARDPERPSIIAPAVTAGLGLLATIVVVALPMRTLPFGQDRADGSFSWMGLTNGVDQGSFVRSWARWNYTGYEGKGAYGEYRDLMLTMERVGAEHGCGRSFWEYEKEINRYGTPMALMLLPHWTDGCIGSMEGLFFEASATTPFHFLAQAELSAAPSSAQRDLPYSGFDIDRGVRHLQLMGVRYYLSTSAQATTAARSHPALTELATSGPWVIFEVSNSALVGPVDNEPAVLDGVEDNQGDWLCRTQDANQRCAGPAVTWFQDLSRWDVLLASSGPASWQRVDVDDPEPEDRRVRRAKVTDIEAGVDRIAFDVDEPGSPVLVKASYFPNWRVRGGDGPYRVAPNLMVVVPTSEHVELTYGREPVEWIAYLMTVAGVLLAVWLATREPLRAARRSRSDIVTTPPNEPAPPQHLMP